MINNPRGSKFKVATTLSRELSLLHITMMGVEMKLGAGIFIGIGNTAKAVPRGSGGKAVRGIPPTL